MSRFEKAISGVILIGVGISSGNWQLAVAGAAIIGGSIIEPDLPNKPKLPSGNQIKSTQRSAKTPAKWIIGRARVGGQLVYTAANRNQRIFQAVYCLAQSPIEGIEAVWIDGRYTKLIWCNPTNSHPRNQPPKAYADQENPPYRTLAKLENDAIRDDDEYRDWMNSVYLSIYPDGPSSGPYRTYTSLPYFTDNIGWNTNDKGNGKAYVALEVYAPEYGTDFSKRIWTKAPNISFLVKGNKIPVLRPNNSNKLKTGTWLGLVSQGKYIYTMETTTDELWRIDTEENSILKLRNLSQSVESSPTAFFASDSNIYLVRKNIFTRKNELIRYEDGLDKHNSDLIGSLASGTWEYGCITSDDVGWIIKDNSLYSINLDDAATTLITVLSETIINLFAVDNELYAINSTGSIYQTNRTTGALTLQGTTDILGTMAFGGSAIIYDALWLLNATTGQLIASTYRGTDSPTNVDLPYQTFIQWTQNAIDGAYWFLRNRLGRPVSGIKLSTFVPNVPLADSTVSVTLPDEPGYEDYPSEYPRYTLNGVFSSGDIASKVLKEIEFAIAGKFALYNGQIHCMPGPPGIDKPILFDITDDDIIEYGEFVPSISLRSKVNAVTMSLDQSPEHEWGEYQLPLYVDTTAEEKDQYRYMTDTGSRAYVIEPVMGLMLQKKHLSQARAQQRWTMKLKPGLNRRNMRLKPGDRVNLSLTEYGIITPVPVLVYSIATNNDDTVGAVFRYEPDGLHADTFILPPKLPTIIDHTRLSIGPLPALEGLSATPGAYLTATTPIQHYIDVEWTNDDFAVGVICTGPGSFESPEQRSDTGSIRILVPSSGTYTIKAYRVDLTGGTDGPISIVTANVTLSDSLIPVIESPMLSSNAFLEGDIVTFVITAQWASSDYDVVVNLSGPSGYKSEQIIASGINTASFTASELGSYTADIALQHRPSGLIGVATEVSTMLNTNSLYPVTPENVTASATAQIVDDGAIRSQITIGWNEISYRTRVVLIQPDNHKQIIESLSTPVIFDVNNQGNYSYIVRHFNVAYPIGGMEITGNIRMSWAHLKPTQQLMVDSIYSIGAMIQAVLEPLSDRDIVGIEIRYRRQELTDTATILGISSEQEWTNAPRLETSSIALGRDNSNIIITIPVIENGRYLLVGRSVNRQGLEGPISQLGTVALAIPVSPVGNLLVGPSWEGTHNHTGVLSDSTFGGILVYDPLDSDDDSAGNIKGTRINRGVLNGEFGWPFGGVHSGETPSWKSPIIDLGKQSNWQIRVIPSIITPPNPQPPNPQASGVVDSSHTINLSYGSTRSLGTTVAITSSNGSLAAASQYIQIEVSLASTWLGAGFTQIRIEWDERI